MNNLDKLWREFFIGEKHQVLSHMVAGIFNDFLNKSLSNKIVLDNDFNKRLLLKVDRNDLSTTSKLADTFFETRFFNKNGLRIRCNIGSALRKYHNESLISLGVSELEKLKVDIHKFSQFETVSKIFLQTRNINAHWQIPVNDIGHSALVAGAVLRFLELFDFQDFSSEQVEKIRFLATQILLKISNVDEGYDNKDNVFITQDLKNKVPKTDNRIAEDLVTYSNNEETIQKNSESQQNDNETELPNINFTPVTTKEQKRQLLLKLSNDLLSDIKLEDLNIKRPNYILSRQCIKEFLYLNVLSYEDLLKCPNMLILSNSLKKETKKQLDLYSEKILKILNN
jgi:hypothetical protein